MNKRMQQLAGRALDKAIPYTWTRLDYDEIQKLQEYFAELIVKECLHIVDDAERGGSNEILDNAVKFIRKDLKEHFGVEQ